MFYTEYLITRKTEDVLRFRISRGDRKGRQVIERKKKKSKETFVGNL